MKAKRGAASGHSLQEAIALFLAQYKKKSQETYGYNLKNFATFTGPDRPIEAITALHILEYQQHIESRPIKLATRATYFRTVKVFFNWLVKAKLLDESPARLLRTPRSQLAVEKSKAMTDEELKKILDWAKWRPRDFALILFLADTGCRAGGAAGLRVQDIDFENMRAMVTEKGEKTRPVSFEPVCARALQAWMKKRPADAGEYVFSVTDQPVQAASISQVITRACLRAGVRPLGSHSLRHRKGHQLAFGLIPPTLAAQAMGHSNPNTTMESYYPTSWSKVDEIMRGFGVKEEDVSGQTPPPQKGDQPEKPRLIVLRKRG
jgi:integrase